MKYAKIVDGHLEYAPRNQPGISNWINDEAAVLAAGYLPVSEEAIPQGYVFNGWEVRAGEIVPILEKIPEPTVDEQNEAIRRERELRYVAEADSLKYDYEEAVARGAANVDELKTAWLTKKDEIRESLPYIVEEIEASEEDGPEASIL